MMLILAIPKPEILEFDFGVNTGGQDWVIVNDGVMGGQSLGNYEIKEESLLFKGKLSLANNGGFASLRSPWSEYDLSGYKTVTLKIRGSGGEFGLTLQSSSAYYEPTFRYLFTPQDEWQVLEIPLDEFEKTRLGISMGEKLNPKDADKIIRMGFIKSDKKTEDFTLEVDYLKFQ